MEVINTMRQACGLPVESTTERQDREQVEADQEQREFKAQLKACVHRHDLVCSLTAEIEKELRRVKLGPAELAVVDEMQRSLIAVCQAVAINNPDSGRQAYQAAVEEKISEWIKENPIIGGVIQDTPGMVDRIVSSVVDAVMQARAVVKGPEQTATDSEVGKRMEQAAGIDPSARP